MDKIYAKYDNRNMKTLCVVDYPGAYLSCVYGIKDILEYDLRGVGRHFSVSIVAPEDLCSDTTQYDYLVFPPCRIMPTSPELGGMDVFYQNIRDRVSGGSIPVSVCAGAFFLCASGLGDGKRVVTHWNLASRLQVQYPAVKVKKNDILIDEGNVISAGGMTGFQDLCLYLIKKTVSEEAAMLIASVFLINTGERSQLEYVIQDLGVSDDGILGVAQRYIHAEFRRDLSLNEIASQCGVSGRTLLRRFRDTTEYSPQEYLQYTRFAHAKKLLSGSDLPVKAVAEDCGYSDLSSFTRTFGRLVGVSPGEYRRRQRSSFA